MSNGSRTVSSIVARANTIASASTNANCVSRIGHAFTWPPTDVLMLLYGSFVLGIGFLPPLPVLGERAGVRACFEIHILLKLFDVRSLAAPSPLTPTLSRRTGRGGNAVLLQQRNDSEHQHRLREDQHRPERRAHVRQQDGGHRRRGRH